MGRYIVAKDMCWTAFFIILFSLIAGYFDGDIKVSIHYAVGILTFCVIMGMRSKDFREVVTREQIRNERRFRSRRNRN